MKCTSLIVTIAFPTNDYLDISKFQHSRHGTHTLQHKIKVFASVSLKFPETWWKEWSRKVDTTKYFPGWFKNIFLNHDESHLPLLTIWRIVKNIIAMRSSSIHIIIIIIIMEQCYHVINYWIFEWKWSLQSLVWFKNQTMTQIPTLYIQQK